MSPAVVARTALVLLLFLLVQSTVMTDITIAGVHPDVILLLPVAAAVVAGSAEGAVVGFAGGLMIDLFLPTPFGLTALIGCLLGVGVGMALRRADRSIWWLGPVAALAGSAAAVLVYAALGAVLGQGQFLRVDLLAVVLVVSLTNALLASPAVRVMRWSLARTGPRERSVATSRW